MLESGQIITMEKFNADGIGWFQWTFDMMVKKPVSWMLGYASNEINYDEETFVLPRVLQVKFSSQKFLRNK